jgi:signal transduction histidine kinase
VLDVTQRREAEAALRAAERRKDVFLATLAHELRNPLAPLRNGLQIARLSRLDGDPTLRRTIDMMERQLAHLVRLVDDLLDVGRIAAEKLQLRHEPVVLAQVLAASIEGARSAIERNGLELDIKAAGEALYVLGVRPALASVQQPLGQRRQVHAARWADRRVVVTRG